MPKGEDEVCAFLRLRGHTTEAKLAKEIIMRYPDKVIAVITARLLAEKTRRAELQGALPEDFDEIQEICGTYVQTEAHE